MSVVMVVVVVVTVVVVAVVEVVVVVVVVMMVQDELCLFVQSGWSCGWRAPCADGGIVSALPGALFGACCASSVG